MTDTEAGHKDGDKEYVPVPSAIDHELKNVTRALLGELPATLPIVAQEHQGRAKIYRASMDRIRERFPRIFKCIQICLIMIIIFYAAFAILLQGHLSTDLSLSGNNSRSELEAKSATVHKSIVLLQSLYTFISLIVGLPVSLPIQQSGASDQQSLDIINSQLERLLGLLAKCNTTSASCF